MKEIKMTKIVETHSFKRKEVMTYTVSLTGSMTELVSGDKERVSGFLRFWNLYRPETEIVIYSHIEYPDYKLHGVEKKGPSVGYQVFLGKTKEWRVL